jgi:hypothetical protein
VDTVDEVLNQALKPVSVNGHKAVSGKRKPPAARKTRAKKAKRNDRKH